MTWKAGKLIAFFFFSLSIFAFGQEEETTDTTIVSKILKADSLFVVAEELPIIRNNRLGTYLSRVVNNSKNYAIELGKLKLIISEFPDTVELSERIPVLKNSTETLKEFTSKDQDLLNQRYLKGVENFISTLEREKEGYEFLIGKRMNDLLEVGKALEKIRNDSILNLTLRDTTLAPQITRELDQIRGSINQLDSLLIQQEVLLTKFQGSISEVTIALLDLSQFFKQSEIAIRQRSLSKEINYLWEPKNYGDQISIRDEFNSSFRINYFVLNQYIENNSVYMWALFLTIILLYFYIKSTLNKISRQKEFADLILERVTFLRKNLFSSCLVIVIPIFFLLFRDPPLIFSSILSFILVLFSALLVKQHFGNRIFNIWLIFIPLYLVGPTIGLHWQLTYAERPLIYGMSIGGLLLGYFMFKEVNGKKFNGSSILLFLSIFLLLFSAFTLGANAFGRFSLAKSYIIPGITGFYRGISLYLFTQVFLKAVYLIIESRKSESDVISTFFDFQEIQKRIQNLLNIVAVGLWVYSIIFYLGFFDPLYEGIVEFLQTDRIIGNTEFQFGTILLSIIIVFISAFLANNIAYFASIQDQKSAHSRTKRLGSSILLIRLGIITIGFFLAMAAAEIPLDKLAIVLGALSVGIGFGLQTIINNLVSGIILAFERPIQIGDEIQVGTLSGTVKEVGVRASKIQAYDGSEIILPNGDLLSQSLINWTLSDKRRRVELIIGVAYDSDMAKVKELIEKALVHEKILSNPHSKVLMQNFGDSSVDFRVLFWVESIDFWIDVRAEMMTAIFKTFAENNIEIPFPKRDLYLKTIPSSWKETVLPPSKVLDANPNPNEEESPKTKKSSEG